MFIAPLSRSAFRQPRNFVNMLRFVPYNVIDNYVSFLGVAG